MRTIYGILLVSLLSFLASIWFVVSAARTGGGVPPGEPIASVKQLMDGMVTPSSNAVYGAVSTIITKDGTEEHAPDTDREWDVVGSHAVALIETAGLLTVPGRAKDGGRWMELSDQMKRAATMAYGATRKKDPDALLAAGEVLNNACDACHQEYEVNVE